MELLKENLIMSTKNFSVYEELTNNVQSERKIGGYITVVDNNNNEKCWKEWKWFRINDGTYFNDRDDVIEMLLYAMNHR